MQLFLTTTTWPDPTIVHKYIKNMLQFGLQMDFNDGGWDHVLNFQKVMQDVQP